MEDAEEEVARWWGAGYGVLWVGGDTELMARYPEMGDAEEEYRRTEERGRTLGREAWQPMPFPSWVAAGGQRRPENAHQLCFFFPHLPGPAWSRVTRPP